MVQTIEIKVKNVDLASSLGVKVGDIVNVECKDGVPLEKEWRNRIKDSEIDDCVEIVQSKKSRNTSEGK